MAHPNEDLVREAFAAFGRGDLDALRTSTSPKASVTTSPGRPRKRMRPPGRRLSGPGLGRPLPQVLGVWWGGRYPSSIGCGKRRLSADRRSPFEGEELLSGRLGSPLLLGMVLRCLFRCWRRIFHIHGYGASQSSSAAMGSVRSVYPSGEGRPLTLCGLSVAKYPEVLRGQRLAELERSACLPTSCSPSRRRSRMDRRIGCARTSNTSSTRMNMPQPAYATARH